MSKLWLVPAGMPPLQVHIRNNARNIILLRCRFKNCASTSILHSVWFIRAIVKMNLVWLLIFARLLLDSALRWLLFWKISLVRNVTLHTVSCTTYNLKGYFLTLDKSKEKYGNSTLSNLVGMMWNRVQNYEFISLAEKHSVRWLLTLSNMTRLGSYFSKIKD